MARFTVTPLGAPRTGITRLAAELSLYLVESAELDVRLLVGVSSHAQAGDAKAVTAYYAAGGLAAPRWSGGGLGPLGFSSGEIVDPGELRVLLTGRNPRTGKRIISASGSHGRRHLRVGTPTIDASATEAEVDLWDERDAAALVGLSLAEFRSAVTEHLVPSVLVGDRAMFDHESLETIFETPQAIEVAATAVASLQGPLSAAEAGRVTGFDPTHIRRLCRAYRDDPNTEASRCIQARQAGPGDDAKSGQWLIEPGALARWMRERVPPSVRMCVDVTFTIEKSVSLFALLLPVDMRREAVKGILGANDVGIAYLDESAARHRRQSEGISHVEDGDGLSAATFVHATSRADDPNVHCHNPILNSVRGGDGTDRALELSAMYRATAVASHLATAYLRCYFAERFGVGFAPRSDGKTVEIDGITSAQIDEFSSRRAEIESALEELERLGMPADATVAALGTRPAKSNVDPAQLRGEWSERARSVGLTPEDLEALCSHERHPTPPLSRSEHSELMKFLGSAEGATATRSEFTEADVMAAALRWVPAGQRRVRLLTPQMLNDVTTDFLCSQQAIPLLDDAPAATTAKGQAIGGRREEVFTTRRCVEVQHQIQAAFEQSLDRQAARVPEPLIDEALRRYGQDHGALSGEQADMVRAWCGSGHGIQSAIGRPGTGKTHTCAAAAAVWSSAGFTVIGAAVKGEAARLLGKEARIDSETIAKRLSQVRRGELRLDPRTVLIVDESSTLSDDDLHALCSATQSAGCALRLVGDPAQHRSVAAGGMWAHLITRWAANTPELTESRRLTDPADIQAAEAARQGNTATALEILRSAGQLSEFESRPKMLAEMLRRWQTLRDDNRPAPIVTRDRHTVSVLNGACQELLIKRGEVQPPVQYGHLELGVGDEVIARRTDRTQHQAGQTSGYVRNGARGTITAANSQQLTVAFDGIGKLSLPAGWVANGGVSLAYALTSHAVQGATQPASTSIISQGATRPELVVNITRGTHDNHVAIVHREDAGLARWRHTDDEDLITSVARSIHDKPNTPAIALIPTEARQSLAALKAASQAGLLTQHEDEVFAHGRTRQIQRRARHNPDAALRPLTPPPTGATAWMRALWRRAAEAAATYRDRWTPRTRRTAQPTQAVLGQAPQLPPARQAEYDHAAAAIHDALNAITQQVGPHHPPTLPSEAGPNDWISDLEQSPSMLDNMAALRKAAQDHNSTLTTVQTDIDDYNAVSAIGIR